MNRPSSAGERSSNALPRIDFLDGETFPRNARTDPLGLEIADVTEYEVRNHFAGDPTVTEGPELTDCIVKLGVASEFEMGEGNHLLIDGDMVFTGEDADENEIQFKRGNTVELTNSDFILTLPGTEAEVQFEEDFCLRVSGDITITVGNTVGPEDEADIQLKKVNPGGLSGSPCDDGKNIFAGGSISMVALGEDSEVQIEENNWLDADGAITLSTSAASGQTEIKKGSLLTAGGTITLSGAQCVIEEGVATAAPGADTSGCGEVVGD